MCFERPWQQKEVWFSPRLCAIRRLQLKTTIWNPSCASHNLQISECSTWASWGWTWLQVLGKTSPPLCPSTQSFSFCRVPLSGLHGSSIQTLKSPKALFFPLEDGAVVFLFFFGFVFKVIFYILPSFYHGKMTIKSPFERRPFTFSTQTSHMQIQDV